MEQIHSTSPEKCPYKKQQNYECIRFSGNGIDDFYLNCRPYTV